jgi:low temperature requirement protein LtrA
MCNLMLRTVFVSHFPRFVHNDGRPYMATVVGAQFLSLIFYFTSLFTENNDVQTTNVVLWFGISIDFVGYLWPLVYSPKWFRDSFVPISTHYSHERFFTIIIIVLGETVTVTARLLKKESHGTHNAVSTWYLYATLLSIVCTCSAMFLLYRFANSNDASHNYR